MDLKPAPVLPITKPGSGSGSKPTDSHLLQEMYSKPSSIFKTDSGFTSESIDSHDSRLMKDIEMGPMSGGSHTALHQNDLGMGPKSEGSPTALQAPKSSGGYTPGPTALNIQEIQGLPATTGPTGPTTGHEGNMSLPQHIPSMNRDVVNVEAEVVNVEAHVGSYIPSPLTFIGWSDKPKRVISFGIGALETFFTLFAMFEITDEVHKWLVVIGVHWCLRIVKLWLNEYFVKVNREPFSWCNWRHVVKKVVFGFDSYREGMLQCMCDTIMIGLIVVFHYKLNSYDSLSVPIIKIVMIYVRKRCTSTCCLPENQQVFWPYEF